LSTDGQIANKRFLCSRNGFNKSNDDKPNAPTKKKKKRAVKRCGCDANIYVKLGADKKYHISSFVEEHNHTLVSPDKTPFLHSNRVVSQRAKNTLFTCHKASIGTSLAYRLLQVTDGGFSTIGCTKRDLQNYYRGLREKIKNADAQLFIAQMFGPKDGVKESRNQKNYPNHASGRIPVSNNQPKARKRISELELALYELGL
jgi:hypothetical protein